MNKFFWIVIGLFLFSNLSANAGNFEIFDYGNMNMKNFWQENGKYEQKVIEVGSKIINANKLDKRIPINLNHSTTTINAYSSANNKTVVVYYGLLPYLDNDDELAAVIGHEMSHSIDSYGGPFKWLEVLLNEKEYEYKADLVGIDLMVKAGYNPIAAICMANKWMPESYWDFGIFTSHPKTSKRLVAMYKYIYVKYPWALKTDMIHNVNYENFEYSSKKEINEFLQHEKERAGKHIEDI